MELNEASVAKQFMSLWDKQDRDGTRQLAQDLVEQDSDRWTAVVRSFNALWELEDIAAQHQVPDRFRPNIWWMRGPYPGNFGDILTPYVLWHAFGIVPRWSSAKKAKGLCIGSIAKFSHAGSLMWGSGMPRPNDPLAPDAVWAAVRGPLSRDAVLAAGGTMAEVYGDGAVLLPEIYAPQVEKTHRVGIIPHVLQEQQVRDTLAKTGRSDEVKVINLLAADFADIERVVRDILSCDEIVSTSLHGVIVSHAYGIPCQSARIVAPGEEAEDSFKMRDYKASVGLEDRPIGIPNRYDDIDWLDARQCSLPPKPIDTAALRAAFPFETPEKEKASENQSAARIAQKKASDAALATAKSFLAEGRMKEAAAASDDAALQARRPHLILAHIAALIGLGVEADIDAFAAATIAGPTTLTIKLELLRQLAMGGYAQNAGLLILAHPDLQSHRSFVRTVRLVNASLSPSPLRKKLVQLIKDNSHVNLATGQTIPTDIAFQKQGHQTDWGRVRINHSPATSLHHVAGLEAEEVAFNKKANAPRQPNVVEYRDVFTDARGQVWKADGSFLVYRSQPVASYDPVPAATFDVAFAANRGSRGIYHWIIDYLPMFAWLLDRKAAGEPVPPILINAGNGRFERDSLALLGLSDDVVEVAPGAPVKVDRLLTSRVGFRGLVGWTHLESVFGPIVARALDLAHEHGASLPRRVYISRRAVARRPMANEADVEAHAQSLGFEVLDFATLPLWHQIAIAHNAETIMSPHGAGLSHLIFAKPGTQVIELLPIHDGTYQLRFNYARLSMLKGLDYSAWLEPQQPQMSSWHLDMDNFKPFLADMLADKVR